MKFNWYPAMMMINAGFMLGEVLCNLVVYREIKVIPLLLGTLVTVVFKDDVAIPIVKQD